MSTPARLYSPKLCHKLYACEARSLCACLPSYVYASIQSYVYACILSYVYACTGLMSTDIHMYASCLQTHVSGHTCGARRHTSIGVERGEEH